MSNLKTALDARSKGIVAIPCHAGTKIPAVKWKQWQSEMPPIELQRDWFREPCNIAIVTTGMVVFDCDDPAKADLVVEKCGETSHMLTTPRGGVHLGYRRRTGVAVTNRVKIKGMDIDIRTDGGLELIPDSETEAGRYAWLSQGLRPISELYAATVGWTRECPRSVAAPILPDPNLDAAARRALAYVRNILSVSGKGGHNACYRAACKCREFGLTRDLALRVMLVWNQTNAHPEWSYAEILHKVDSVFNPRKRGGRC